jgi:glycosyltransferase involved in cell wall biosynthesis
VSRREQEVGKAGRPAYWRLEHVRIASNAPWKWIAGSSKPASKRAVLTGDNPSVDLSVVVPVYNAEKTIAALVQQLLDVYRPRGMMQVVLVNDGSRDRSHDLCLGMAEKFPGAITYLRLAKNFGEHNAVMAGLRHALGAYVVVMDDDFQHRPEDAVRLCDEARSNDLDLVYAYFPRREHGLGRRLGSRFNGWVANIMLDKPRDLYLSSFKCMSRWLVREIVRYRGPFPYVDGLALRCTRNLGKLEVVHHPREAGRSGYTLRKLVAIWSTMFVSFSVMPLRVSALLGFVLIGLSAAGSGYVLLEKLAGRPVPEGWPFLALIILLFSGAQLLTLGIVGEYVGRLYLAINETPQAVIRDSWGLGAPGRWGDHD